MTDRNRVFITGIGVVSPLGGREEFWQRLVAGERAIRSLDVSPEEQPLWLPQVAGAPARLRGSLREELRSRDAGLTDSPASFRIPDAVRAGCIIGTSKGGVHSQHRLLRQRAEHRRENRTAEAAGHRETAPPQSPAGDLRSGEADLGAGGSRPLDAAVQPEAIAEAISSTFRTDGMPAWPQTGETDGMPASLLGSMVAPHGAASAVSSLFGLGGPLLTPVAACATGLAALVRGAMLIESGVCDLVVAGSSDASLTPAIVASFRRLGVLSKRVDDPASAVRPFDRSRDGFFVGEGAAVFVMESEQHARNCSAAPYAEWLAGGSVADTCAMTRLSDNPEALCRLISDVLQRSRLSAGEIDYLSLHGTATRMNDECEMRALRELPGPAFQNVSASSIKGAIGHLLGAAGAVEFASMLLAMRDSTLPPTVNLHSPDDGFDLDLVPHVSKSRTVNHAMKLSLGFGGHLFAAAVRRV